MPRPRIRYAVVGLGYIAQAEVLPEFLRARRNSMLAALVSGDRTKRRQLSRRYGVPAYSYEEYETCLQQESIDAAYLALPNHLHREYTERTARAGVHVLCEKPMAVTASDCEAMIAAARAAGVKLMIAYRLHFEQANLEVLKLVRRGALGPPRLFQSLFTMTVKAGDIRLMPESQGGGTLYDIGVYCINAARAIFRDEPLEAWATGFRGRAARFRDTHEAVSAVLRFSQDRVAAFTCSFGGAEVSMYQIVGPQGTLRLDPAYEHAGPLKYALTAAGKTRRRTFAERAQFAAELLYFSDCILQRREPEPSGAEGLADIRVIEALYAALRQGQPARVQATPPVQRPEPSQQIAPAPVEAPSLVHAASPSGAR